MKKIYKEWYYKKYYRYDNYELIDTEIDKIKDNLKKKGIIYINADYIIETRSALRNVIEKKKENFTDEASLLTFWDFIKTKIWLRNYSKNLKNRIKRNNN